MKPIYDEDYFENDGMIPDFDDIPEEMMPDDFSPTSLEKDPFETDEEYEERIQDQEDLLDFYDE